MPCTAVVVLHEPRATQRESGSAGRRAAVKRGGLAIAGFGRLCCGLVSVTGTAAVGATLRSQAAKCTADCTRDASGWSLW
jgi:hypothetical protein